MQATLLPNFYNENLAPAFAEFSGAALEDLSAIDEQQEYWLYNLALNQLSRAYKPVFREWAFNLVRRAHGAFEAYHQLRALLSDYPPYRKAARRYFAALNQAEICVSFAGQAFEIAQEFMGKSGEPLSYQYVTQLDVDQLRMTYNTSKHVATMVHGSQTKGADTLLVWLTPEGLASRRRGVLTYAQLSALLRELAHDAALLSTIQD
jgi:hypothetical protein